MAYAVSTETQRWLTRASEKSTTKHHDACATHRRVSNFPVSLLALRCFYYTHLVALFTGICACGMANQAPSYEVALFGDFYSKDLRAVLTRCALHAEHTYPFHAREVVFEPIDASAQREAGTEPVLLRARREVRIVNNENNVPDDVDQKMPKKGKRSLKEQVADAEWILYSYLKPESARMHPEATVRPWAVTEVIGNALEFASALGYV